MAKIGHLLICENYGRDEEDRRFLINPKVTFLINELKTNIDFTVSIGIYEITNNNFHVTVEVFNPNGDLISQRERDFSHPNPKEDTTNVAFSAIVNVSFKEVLIQQLGEYTIKATVEGDEKTLTIPIVQQLKEVK